LYYALEKSYEALRELSSGDGGRGGLNKKILKEFEIKVPPSKKEQKAIASILNVMDEEISVLVEERNKIIQIKDGAMDDLLTGKVRLV
jgi:type I restriction enzyme S subunit